MMADLPSQGTPKEIQQLKATDHNWGTQNTYIDYARSVDQIYKEGSDPSGKARFHSSSGRNPDKDD